VDVNQRAEAAERSRSLTERVEALARRIARLRDGDRVNVMDIERAQEAADAALRHNAAAHVRAASAFRSAATAHRRAGARAALVGAHGQAEAHRAAAKADDESAEAHLLAAEADQPGSRDPGAGRMSGHESASMISTPDRTSRT
jgi:hypothetical protein